MPLSPISDDISMKKMIVVDDNFKFGKKYAKTNMTPIKWNVILSITKAIKGKNFLSNINLIDNISIHIQIHCRFIPNRGNEMK